jgi:vacuolar-type H+-ATPase subunit C/Vma6
MNDKPIIKNCLKDYEYGYISSYLKAREGVFLKSAQVKNLYQSVTLKEIFKNLQNSRYASVKMTLDAKDFENALWSFYFKELNEIAKILPEEYINVFLEKFHSVIFSQEEIFPLLLDKPFPERLDAFQKIAESGTSYTKEISSYIVDRFNFFKCIRNRANSKDEEISLYYGGGISNDSLHFLFKSNFETVELDLIQSLWMPFIEKERPVKKYDFSFMYRYESYWWIIFWRLMREPNWESSGPDYIISYFGRFIMEIEMIKKLYICTRYSLPCHNLKEMVINAAW